MAITRWTPFQDMYTLQNSLNSFLREVNRGEDESLSSSAFVPPVDIYEDANHIVLKLEVPGMKLEDFNIQLENNALTVRGERRFEKETKEENYHRVERRYGSFARVFTLPNTLDPESVKANYDAGVLTVELASAPKPSRSRLRFRSAPPPQQVQKPSTPNRPSPSRRHNSFEAGSDELVYLKQGRAFAEKRDSCPFFSIHTIGSLQEFHTKAGTVPWPFAGTNLP